VKYPDPKKYDGRPNVEEIESFAYSFLAGKALNFYMLFVQGKESSFTTQKFFHDLFNYVFQGDSDTREFLRNLRIKGKQLRSKWAEAGFSAETSSLDSLAEAAER